jgi:transcriptional regulator
LLDQHETMTLFPPKEPSDIRRLIEAYPLCWVVSGGEDERYATPLPLLPEEDEGRLIALLGHIARANPQQGALEKDPRATILCMGANGYVSPTLVSNPTWGPTWNYAVCRFETWVRFVPDENDAALSRLSAALEGTGADCWNPSLMGERYHELKKHIVAFRADVLETHARFKLGQDETEVVFNDIVEGLADRTLAEWMIRARR